MDSVKPIHIINVPLDLGASRRGTDAGPSALRIAGLSAGLVRLGYEVGVETDIPVPGMEAQAPKDTKARFKDEILQVCTTLAETVRDALAAGRIPLVIGGDHSIAMGTVSGIAAHLKPKGQDFGVLWFDAHGDMNSPDTSPSGNIHGMPVTHLLGHGDSDLSSILGINPAVKPENVVLIGIRDIDRKEREFIRASGVSAFTMRDIDERGMSRVAREALDILNDGTAGFHISFDVDGCDPAVIPGSGTLVPGGVSYREAHLLMELCAEHGGMLSMELVELNPFLDHRNVSAERAVALIQSAFGRSIL
ncbi:MAG: arginase [Woeseiaceae bacterium]|nr:arginase [Woeseiaceae bacterium]